MALITKNRAKQLAQDEAVYNDYQELMAENGAMPIAVNESICEKYGFTAIQTVYSIRKRVEKRLKAEGKL